MAIILLKTVGQIQIFSLVNLLSLSGIYTNQYF